MIEQQDTSRKARYAHWDKLGLDRVKADLMHTRGIMVVGGPQEVQEMAWEWVHMKEAEAKADEESKPRATGHGLALIAESRLCELRNLNSASFDLRKLVRLCEELNIAFGQECYLATAMLTRGLLDHVPPLFGHASFKEVANNYSGGGKSFREAIQHLENASRKIADAHLHMPIRNSETLPTAQQVHVSAPLDMLLAEIVRITK